MYQLVAMKIVLAVVMGGAMAIVKGTVRGGVKGVARIPVLGHLLFVHMKNK